MQHDFTAINNRPMFLLKKPRKLKLTKNQPYLNGKLILLDGPERIDYGWWDYNINRDIPEIISNSKLEIVDLETMFLPGTPRIAGFNYWGTARTN